MASLWFNTGTTMIFDVYHPLARFKAIGAARPDPATVNDVLLATIAGGLPAASSACAFCRLTR